MTTNDQMIPADKVRAARDLHRDAAKMATITDAEREIHQHVADAMEALLPPPPLPTLADMTEEERAACLRMQCDTAPNRSVRGFIADIYPGGCRVIERDTWEWRSCSDDMVTPRPDLPRMEWPGAEKPAPAPALPEGWRLADHKDNGRVIVTRPEPDADGKVVIICPLPDRVTRADMFWCKRDKLTYTDQEADQ